MKRLTLRTENQWRSLKDGAGVDLLRVSFVCNGFQVGAGITVAGLGLGLTYWKRAAGTWGGVIGAAVSSYVEWPYDGGTWRTTDGMTYAWEPIETNGWAGEPQGREHGA
jgi:hypothetical protein